jgi:hypothetical protein
LVFIGPFDNLHITCACFHFLNGIVHCTPGSL